MREQRAANLYVVPQERDDDRSDLTSALVAAAAALVQGIGALNGGHDVAAVLDGPVDEARRLLRRAAS